MYFKVVWLRCLYNLFEKPYNLLSYSEEREQMYKVTIGGEEKFIEKSVDVIDEVRRVLYKKGSLIIEIQKKKKIKIVIPFFYYKTIFVYLDNYPRKRILFTLKYRLFHK